MKNLIQDFTKHLGHSIDIGSKVKFKNTEANIVNICISGLGGSGIGGSIVSDLVLSSCSKPIILNKGYHLPGFVSDHTLVIISSYSGNTEETLEALSIAEQRGAQIACITSGGKLKEIAIQKGYNYIEIPGGYPPRAAFGYSSLQSLFILNQYNLIHDDFVAQLHNTVKLLDAQKKEIQDEAELIAKSLLNTIPVIYTEEKFAGVAVRFRQQINENSKMLCWHHVVPEMNHNELVGWAGSPKNVFVVWLRSNLEYYRNAKRLEINQSIIKDRGQNSIEIWAKGENIIEQSYYFIHLCDWVSYYLAELKEIDATEVSVINKLKTALAKI